MSEENRREVPLPPRLLANPEDVCHRLVPSQYWDAIMSALGTSIALAHQHGPERWGIRLAPDSIMLKVGPHEVLQLGAGEQPFHLIVDKATVPPALRGLPTLWFSEDRDCYGHPGTQGYYPSNPGSEACEMPLERVKDTYPALLQAHTTVIARAATKRRHTTTQRTHSPALVWFVADVLGQSLPQPTYCATADPGPRPLLAEELRGDERFPEGAARQILVNAYERDRRARQRCLAHYGPRCAACGLSFEERYGPEAAGLIHVHHLVPLSEIGEQYEVDPIRDLRPLCPNCHTVIHATKPVRTVEQLTQMLRSS
jgi:5-methylcytosine-specific restriction protein A